MIYLLEKNNLSILDNTFIDKDYLLNEYNNNPFAKVLILEESGTVIGYLYYSDIYDRLEINQIEIEKSHRNCGKGDYLLRFLTTSVNKGITLEVRIDNIPALKLYKKNGFREKAIRKGYYNGVDGILMERK